MLNIPEAVFECQECLITTDTDLITSSLTVLNVVPQSGPSRALKKGEELKVNKMNKN